MMSSDIISITCPCCGAGIGDLHQIGRRQRNTKKPLFFYKCTKCNHEFDITTKHCRQIIADILAMKEINRVFFATNQTEVKIQG